MTYYSYACGTTSSDVLVLETATNGGNRNPAPAPTGDDSDPLASIPGLAIPSTAGSSTGAGQNGGHNKSVLSIGIIVAIVVVGGALSIAAGIVCWCLLRRHRENDRVIKNPSMAQPPYQPTNPTGSIYSWNAGVPVGAPPSVAPSRLLASEYSGRTMVASRFGHGNH